MSTNLFAAHNEWRDRPPDERFWGLSDMGAALQDARIRSNEVRCRVSKVQAIVGTNGASLCLTDGRDPMELTHWSMGQLATYADAPASYLRTLPRTWRRRASTTASPSTTGKTCNSWSSETTGGPR